MRLAGDVDFFHGELGLVDEAYALRGPLQGLNHDSSLVFVVGR